MMKLHCFSKIKLLELLKDAYLKESIFWTKNVFPEMEDFVKSSERDEMVSFLLEICEVKSFNIETFNLAISLLDRFLASYKVKTKYLECLAVTCLFIACKIKEEDDKISITSDFLFDCNSKCSVSELLRMELMVCSKFEWAVKDITATDFLHIYHAILVNKFNESFDKLAKNTESCNKWKVDINSNEQQIDKRYVYPPADLDFMHLLEYELKQLLCANELISMFKPRILAFTLLSIKLNKEFENIKNDTVISKSFNSKVALKKILEEEMEMLKVNSKITDDVFIECREKIKFYLTTVDTNKILLEKYMEEYYSEKLKNYRISSNLSYTLSTIETNLTAIKEEEEEDEDLFEKNILSLNNNLSVSSENFKNENIIVTEPMINFSEIVFSKRDQKRKLAENSIKIEELKMDYENRLC